MPAVPEYDGSRKQLEFLLGVGKEVMKLIDSKAAVGNREIERALKGYSFNDRIVKGVTTGAVTSHLNKLKKWGLVEEVTDPHEIAEMDLERKHAGQLKPGRQPQKRHVLTDDGKALLDTMDEHNGRPNSERLEAAKKIMNYLRTSNLSPSDRDDLISLADDVKLRSARGEDPAPALKAIFDLGSQLERQGVRRWHDVNELRNLLIELPAKEAPDDAKVQSLRILQLVLRSSSYHLRAGYQTRQMVSNLTGLILESTGESGREAFLSYMRMRDGRGMVTDEQINLFLDVLWRCHKPNYMDPTTRSEAVFQVAREWRSALSKQQKEWIRTSLGHLRAKDADIFKKSIASGSHANEEREIDAERYRVTLAQLSSYV